MYVGQMFDSCQLFRAFSAQFGTCVTICFKEKNIEKKYNYMWKTNYIVVANPQRFIDILHTLHFVSIVREIKQRSVAAEFDNILVLTF